MNKVLWSEKYCPQSFEQLAQPDAACVLKSYAQQRTIPNLLLYGPSGSGKTTAAYILARELYDEFPDDNLVYFNSSDFFDQGRKYLESEVRFTRFYHKGKSVIETFKEIVDEYASMPPISADFKLIFFDDADSLTRDAQTALRRMTEKYNRSSRFVFAVRHLSRIIAPIRSRCVGVHFTPVADEKLAEVLRRLAEAEDVSLLDDGLDAIIGFAHGDVRLALDILQAAASGGEVSGDVVRDVFLDERYVLLERLADSAMGGDFMGARNALSELIIDRGLRGDEVLMGVRNVLMDRGLSEVMMARALLLLGDVDMGLAGGLHEHVHLERLAAELFGL